jgi:ABC-type branched-subunit amino acid transport system substrate-binding protein
MKLRSTLTFGLITASVATGCSALLSLGDYTIGPADASMAEGGGDSGTDAADDVATDSVVYECTTNAECTARATAAGPTYADAAADAADSGPVDQLDSGTVPAICVKSVHKCARVLSTDCNAITGDYLNDNAILVATMFTTKPASQLATNLPRQQSATLAAEEINSAGGIPGANGSPARPLVVVSCDEGANLVRVGAHLVNDLHVPAIVGPNTSQDTIDLTQKISAGGGTLVMTPTGVASSITSLADNNLAWRDVPSDVQRAPLMISQINEIELKDIKTRNGAAAVKMGIIYRNDALGVGTQTSLNALVLNGQTLSQNISANLVKVDAYDPKAPNQAAIVASYAAFRPDIIALIGTAESITQVMVPLEAAYTGDAGPDAGGYRPFYMLIDSSKVPQLLTAVTGNDDLRHRIRGTGVTPEPTLSAPVYNSFSTDYFSRFATLPSASGTGPSYDAMYSVAYAIAATRSMPVTGANIALGLRRLAASGDAGAGPRISVGPTTILAAFQALDLPANQITGIGTFGPLAWDLNGDVVGGTLEMWCIGLPGPAPAFQSSGLTFDIKTQAYAGSYVQCAP